jgi:Domain of unknown function (DUF932).
MQLITRFNHRSSAIRSAEALSDEAIRSVAPSIFADAKHDSRSDRYSYIPTIQVLSSLRQEGFQPFFACQTRTRAEGRREHTKHMLRLRHANQMTGTDANEIILVNSHDGSSAYQMLAGVFRFVCQNGMVCGDTIQDVRVPHKGDVVGRVIEGAFSVLDQFEKVDELKGQMQSQSVTHGEQQVFARAALALRYDEEAPVSEDQVLEPRRHADQAPDVWSLFNRVQENLVRGGLRGRSSNGRRQTTRPIAGIDQNVRLNRALWILAEGLSQMKS